MKKESILIYGATGYSAGLIIERAVEAGARPILAGRTRVGVEALGRQHGLPVRVFALGNTEATAAHLQDVAVVLNCAGPFSRTALEMAKACLKAGTHYLDITGEIGVFESLAGKDPEGRAAGVMLMPGVGYDVVPSDCLALHLARRLPGADTLRLAFRAIENPSHGTATTMVENLHQGGAIRREGRIVPVPSAWKTLSIDVDGSGRTSRVMSIPWGDVSTAMHSTGIPNIEVFISVPLGLVLFSRASRYLSGLLGTSVVQNFVKQRIPAGGPDVATRARARCHLWCEVSDSKSGASVRARMETPDAYDLTALTAWDIACRVVRESAAQPGFRTPAGVFGADYVLGFPGVRRHDLP